MASRSGTFYVPFVLIVVALIGGCASNSNTGDGFGSGGNSTPPVSATVTSNGPFGIGQQAATFNVVIANISGSTITLAGLGAQVRFPNLQNFVVSSISGTGWTCGGSQGNQCSRLDSLAAGASYPAITIVGNLQGGNSAFTSVVEVQLSTSNKGGVWDFNFSIPITSARLTIAKTHTGDFLQGQQGVIYSITVSNAPGGAATSGTVTVTENLPSGLGLVSLAGSGWSCSGSSCTRSDSLAPGSNYPIITATVNVATDASSPQINQVSVSGGGSAQAAASDSTNIDVVSASPNLTVSKTHTGDFVQGQQGAIYSITVSNAASGVATAGTVTVTENPPSGLSLVSLAGSGWSCSASSCTRSDVLSPSSSYPVITATLNVADNTSSPQINQVSVSGGGSAPATASDSTTIDTVYGSPLIAPPAWQANTFYTMGNVVVSGGLLYMCAVAGTSAASGGPTGTTLTAIPDNTAMWLHYGIPPITVSSPMAPTISYTVGSAPSDLTQLYPSVVSGAAATQFRYLGSYPAISTYGAYPIVTPVSVVWANGSGQQNPFGIQFSTDAPKFSIAADNGSEGYQLVVDGQPVFLGSQKETHLGGEITYITLDFTNAGGRKARTVTLYSGPTGYGNTFFYGVAVDSASMVSAPAPPSTTACVFGDSFTAGGGLAPYNAPLVALDSWPRRVEAILRFGDSWSFAVGGTGYLNPNGFPGDLSQILANSTNAANISANCSLIVVNEGINDYGPYAPSAIQAAVTSDLQTLRSLDAAAPIIVTGIWPGYSGIPASMIAAEQAIQAGSGATGDSNTYFVPIATATPPWMTGTGNVTAPTGIGNADLCMGPTSHPTATCIANWMAPRMVNAIRAVLPSLP